MGLGTPGTPNGSARSGLRDSSFVEWGKAFSPTYVLQLQYCIIVTQSFSGEVFLLRPPTSTDLSIYSLYRLGYRKCQKVQRVVAICAERSVEL